MSGEMYRAQIIEYPEFEEYEAWDERGAADLHGGKYTTLWTRPVGWRPTDDYIEHYRSNKYFEPNTDRWYKSRSSVADRVNLLNSMGYTAIVQRSAPVQWPADGKTKVNTSESRRVIDAIRVLVKAGVVKSADDLL